MATNSGIQMDTDTRILALMSYNRNLAESPPGIGISSLHSEGQQPRNPPGKRPSRPTRVRLSGGTVFRYAWRVLAWTALIHVGDIGEAINVTILLLTHDCFQRAGYPKPTMLVQFLEHLPSLHIEISKNAEVIIPHHLLAIQLERDPKNFLRLPWAGFSGNVKSPQQLPMAFSVSTARRRDHVCRTCCQAVSTWVEHSKYTHKAHTILPLALSTGPDLPSIPRRRKGLLASPKQHPRKRRYHMIAYNSTYCQFETQALAHIWPNWLLT